MLKFFRPEVSCFVPVGLGSRPGDVTRMSYHVMVTDVPPYLLR